MKDVILGIPIFLFVFFFLLLSWDGKNFPLIFYLLLSLVKDIRQFVSFVL